MNIPRTPAERTAALSRAIHDDYLTLGGLSDIPQCLECCALSGLLTGLVRMARELPSKAEYIEALIAEAAETLDLIEADDPPTTATMADHTTHTRVSLLGSAR